MTWVNSKGTPMVILRGKATRAEYTPSHASMLRRVSSDLNHLSSRNKSLEASPWKRGQVRTRTASVGGSSSICSKMEIQISSGISLKSMRYVRAGGQCNGVIDVADRLWASVSIRTRISHSPSKCECGSSECRPLQLGNRVFCSFFVSTHHGSHIIPCLFMLSLKETLKSQRSGMSFLLLLTLSLIYILRTRNPILFHLIPR